MNFKIFGLENELPIIRGVNCLCIENKSFYQKFVYQLLNGEGEGNFCLVDDGIMVEDINKYFEIIVNPFSIKLDDKKLVNAFYKELSAQIVADDEVYSEIINKVSEIQNLLESVESDLDFEIETNENIADILKYFNVSIKKEGNTLLDNLYQYIDLYSRWIKGNMLLFFNCLSLLDDNAIKELHKYAKYHNISIFFVEMNSVECRGINKLKIYDDFSDSLDLAVEDVLQ